MYANPGSDKWISESICAFWLIQVLVTDNGRQFTSVEFHEFVKKNGVKQSFSASHYPATNGAFILVMSLRDAVGGLLLNF